MDVTALCDKNGTKWMSLGCFLCQHSLCQLVCGYPPIRMLVVLATPGQVTQLAIHLIVGEQMDYK